MMLTCMYKDTGVRVYMHVNILCDDVLQYKNILKLALSPDV